MPFSAKQNFLFYLDDDIQSERRVGRKRIVTGCVRLGTNQVEGIDKQ